MDKKEKTVQMIVRIPEGIAREFKALCALKGMTIQAVLARVIKEFIEKEREEKEPERPT